MSAQPPRPSPLDTPQSPPPGAMRCPRCSAPIAAEQDWCLECGAPARTRLAPTPNWRVPTLAIGAIVLIAGALLAFAFVKLTGTDTATPSGTAPVIPTQPAAAPPALTPTAPGTTVTATTPLKTQTAVPPTSVPGQKTPQGTGTVTTPQPANAKKPNPKDTVKKPAPTNTKKPNPTAKRKP